MKSQRGARHPAAMLLAILPAPHPARRYLSLDTTRRCVRRRSGRPDSRGFAVTFAHAMTALGHPRLRRSNYNTVHVRFTPESGQTGDIADCPLCAMCGRLRVGKAFLHGCRLVGAAMCSACLCGHMTAGHNAFRGSGPGQKPAFEMHWHKWVALIAGSTGSALRAVGPPNLHITP